MPLMLRSSRSIFSHTVSESTKRVAVPVNLGQTRHGEALRDRGCTASRRRRTPATTSPDAVRTSSCPSGPIPGGFARRHYRSLERLRRRPRTGRPARASRSRRPARTVAAPPGRSNSVHRIVQARRGALPEAAPAGPPCPGVRRSDDGRRASRQPLLVLPLDEGRRCPHESLLTFSPMPATAQCSRSASMEPSSRMPHTFRPPTSTSLGHLTSTGCPRPR